MSTNTAHPKPKPTGAKPPGTSTPPVPRQTSSSAPSHLSVSATSTLPSGTLGPSPAAEPDSPSKAGLSTPAIAGIAAAGGLILLFIVSVIVCKKRRAYLYAKRPDPSHDPSRDPIDPNDVLPPDTKSNQRFLPLPHNDSGFVSYPLATRNAGSDSAALDQVPLTLNTQRTHQQEYQHYEDHIQSHFAPQSPEPAAAAIIASSTLNGSQIPRSISTKPSMDNVSNSGPLTPSQRAQMNYQQTSQYQGDDGPLSPRSPRSPRSHPLQQPSVDHRSGTDPEIFNEMGNQFVLHSGNRGNTPQNNHSNSDSLERGRDSYEQGSPRRPSESSYRGPTTPNQDAYRGGMRGPPPPPSDPYYNSSGAPSPTGFGPHRGARPGNSISSTYSSPRQGPSQASPRPPHAQYQPQQALKMPISGPGYSPQMYPQQRPLFPNGGPMRSPPMAPTGPASRGPGYSQPSPGYQPSSGQQHRPNYAYS